MAIRFKNSVFMRTHWGVKFGSVEVLTGTHVAYREDGIYQYSKVPASKDLRPDLVAPVS